MGILMKEALELLILLQRAYPDLRFHLTTEQDMLDGSTMLVVVACADGMEDFKYIVHHTIWLTQPTPQFLFARFTLNLVKWRGYKPNENSNNQS